MTSLSFTECLNDKITLVTCDWNVLVRQITVIWKTWASVSSKWDNNFQIWSRRVSNVFLNFKMTRVVSRQKRASPLSPLWVTEPRERSATREAWWGRLSEWSNRKSSASDVCHLTHTRTHSRARTRTHARRHIHMHTNTGQDLNLNSRKRAFYSSANTRELIDFAPP